MKDAKAAAYLNVVPVKKVTRDYTGKSSLRSCAMDSSAMQGNMIITYMHNLILAAQDDHQFVSIIGFECRGMDVVNWHPEVSLCQQPVIISTVEQSACLGNIFTSLSNPQ